jgi:hypothetical protein
MYIGRQKRIFSLISRATFRYLVRSFFSASKRRANIVPFVAFLRQHCLRRVPTFGVDRPSRYLLKDNGCARCASLSRAPVVRPASPCQGPPRCANVVILRGERRNSGKLNAPSAFRSCKLVPTPFPAPRVSAEVCFLPFRGIGSGALCLLARHLMPAYVLSIVSGYNPDVYFCSVRESSGSRLFFFYFCRLIIGVSFV